MSDVCSCTAQDFHLAAVDMHTVREHHIWGCEPDIVQILDIPAAGVTFDHFDLVAVLRSVSMDEYSSLARQSSDALRQLLGATDREARSETVTYSADGVTVPALSGANDSASESSVFSRRRGGTRSPLSIMHFPTVARNPDSSTALKTASVWWTVSIVSAHIVPRINSAIPSRAEA